MEDPVVLIGTQGEETSSIEQMASACGTINYEIMCGIQRRVPRIYLKHGQPAQTLAYLPEE
jgi:alanine racemase